MRRKELTQSQLEKLVKENTERDDTIGKRVAEGFASQLEGLRKQSASRMQAAWAKANSPEHKRALARERYNRRRRP